MTPCFQTLKCWRLFTMLINFKMPINSCWHFNMSMINFMLCWVEYENSFITSGSDYFHVRNYNQTSPTPTHLTCRYFQSIMESSQSHIRGSFPRHIHVSTNIYDSASTDSSLTHVDGDFTDSYSIQIWKMHILLYIISVISVNLWKVFCDSCDSDCHLKDNNLTMINLYPCTYCIYSKTCVKQPLKNRWNKGLNNIGSLMKVESIILLTCIKG